MAELTQKELNQIRTRKFGEYVINAPSVGPFEAVCIVEGVDQLPDTPEWVKELFSDGQIGFFPQKTPDSVGKYWMAGADGKAHVLPQGDWFVKLSDDPKKVLRYPPVVFNSVFGAKEIIAPNGVDSPIERTIVVYEPSPEAAKLAGSIATYIEAAGDEVGERAYHHYLEVLKDMLISGPIPSRLENILQYLEKLAKKASNKRTKYYKFLEQGLEALLPSE